MAQSGATVMFADIHGFTSICAAQCTILIDGDALAALPPDDNHAHGHGKAEYFSSAFEGLFLILVAAISIGYAAIGRLLAPRPLEALGMGLTVSVAASLINLATARLLMTVGRKYNSITLEADENKKPSPMLVRVSDN